MQTYRRKSLETCSSSSRYRERILIPLEGSASTSAEPDEPSVFVESPMDLLEVAGKILTEEVALGILPAAPPPPSTSIFPTLPVHAGEQATLPFRLHNDQGIPAEFLLTLTPLVSTTGQVLSPELIQPQASRFLLAPDALQLVQLPLHIPLETLPGLYTGLLMSPDLPYLQVPVLLNVLAAR